MNLFRLLFAFIVSLAVSVSTSHAGPAKPLEITLVATIQYATHDFYAHTTDHTGPDFQGTSRLFPGQRVDLVVLAKNYALNPAGSASLVYDLAITYPDGRTQQAGHDLRLCVGPVPDSGLLAYASQTASFSTDPGDPPGNYTFTVTAHDRVAGGAPVAKTATLQAIPYAEPALPTDFNPSGWMASYYLNPSPALALPALFKIAAALPRDNTDAWPPILGFYEEVLKANPWLAPVFKARLQNATPEDRTLLLFVLGYAWRHDPAFAGLSKGPWPDVDDGVLDDPRQLDLLWGRFFATGAFAPINRIVSALRMHDALGALDRLKASNPKASSPTPEVMRELVLKSAQWSLGRNARAHPLVYRYCEWILAQNDSDDAFKSLLSTVAPERTPSAERPSVFFPSPP
ncbi:MAG TPA: hypothetical protein VL357_09450 [Rariglobus sp.]|jgi:hypothetical protein|nr:hypothetical protein [Rariglobus sp.]